MITTCEYAESTGIPARSAHVLDRRVAYAATAVRTMKARVDALYGILDGSDPEAKLLALRSLASTIGFSNSIGTAWTELATAAGAVAAILETA